MLDKLALVPALIWLPIAVAALLIWLSEPLARRCGLVDHPKGRKQHEAVTPVSGGIGVFFAILVGFLLLDSLPRASIAFLCAAALLMVLGILDDLRDLRWWWRIGMQIAAALILVYFGRVEVQHVGPLLGVKNTGLGWLSLPMTVVATVGLINAVNMIDGEDGLAGSLVVSIMAMIAAAAFYSGNAAVANRAIIVGGAVIGFLLFNLRFPGRLRARVFLGNGGSAVLGLAIAYFSFRLTQNAKHPVSPVLALWIAVVPVADCLVLIARRLKMGRSPFAADREHVHHLMREAGFGPTRIAVSLSAFSCVAGLIVAQCMRWDVPNPLLLVAFLLLMLGWYLLTSKRVRVVRLFRWLRHLGRAGPAELGTLVAEPPRIVDERS
ncbi:MAG: undecaprenyl/decaprenyl-phosphate alpha-N-acetylglucosaminyl 1-phosphate transferase [Xanthomonadales bacterium]|nr:undecaprenyl/decaprenyl-phosphate alpha-N-acetylglucosaminyl 1-phosphate transferase [Xanthomonadales bacterium]